MALRALHLCSGYGGFELGLRLAGIDVRTVCHVERDSHAAATLVARMEEATLDRAPVWDDLATFRSKAWRGRVDLVTAGFPCQPWSTAGARRGVDDDRWLWPSIARVVRDVGPRLVFLENVPGLNRRQDGGGLAHVLADLADLGFDAEWGLLSAADVGATHRRQRLWLLATLADDNDDGRPQVGREPAHDRESWGDADRSGSSDVGGAGREDAWPPPPDDAVGWERWVAAGGPEPQVRRSTDGRPVGLAESLHLGGNGLVPRVAGLAFLQLAERLGVKL